MGKDSKTYNFEGKTNSNSLEANVHIMHTCMCIHAIMVKTIIGKCIIFVYQGVGKHN